MGNLGFPFHPDHQGGITKRIIGTSQFVAKDIGIETRTVILNAE